MHYTVKSIKGEWRGSYSLSYNKENQPSPLAQAIINAKSHGGTVFLVNGNIEEQVWPK
jgi:hypothetical protein